MLTPLPPNRDRSVRSLTALHRVLLMDRLHAPWQFSSLQLEHVHPFAHDEVVVRIDRAVRLVLDERHEGGQGGAGFVLRGG